jgi:predicted outer membrane lipoprotein
LRRQLVLWSSLVTALALATFGIVAAVNLQWEKTEARETGRSGEAPEDSLGELLAAYAFSS